MNINELTGKLKSIEERERELAENITKLETERKEKEQNQLRLVGQEPKPVVKSEEQVKLETERNSLIVQKNKIHNAIATYNQLKTQAEKSEYNGMTFADFNDSLSKLDSQRKELAEKIEVLETERKEKEQNQLRLVGQEPKPVAKSEEQVRLEKEKQEIEIKFQRLASNINAYNRIIKEIDSIKNEPDFDKFISAYNTLIYNANRSGLPAQLIVDLMTEGLGSTLGNSGIQQSVNSNSNQNIVNDQQQENKEVQKPEEIKKNKTREEEIYDLLSESAKRLKQALDENNSEAIASERSYRQQLLNELNEIKEAEIKKQKEEQIGRINKLLEESSKRLQAALAENNEEAIASERSYRQQLLNKIAEINGVQLNEPVKATPVQKVEAEIEEEPEELKEEEEAIVDEEEIEEQIVEDENVKPEEEELSDAEIKQKIKDIEDKRKKLDSEIIKIDLNAPWEGTPEAMKEFIELGKEVERLKGLLPEEIKRDEVEEKQVVNKEPEQKESEIKEEVKEKKRKPRFRNFFTKTLPRLAVRIGFAIKKAWDDHFNKRDTIEVSDDVEEVITNDEQNDYSYGEDPSIYATDEPEEDENTKDFTGAGYVEDNNSIDETLNEVKDLMQGYMDDVTAVQNETGTYGKGKTL